MPVAFAPDDAVVLAPAAPTDGTVAAVVVASTVAFGVVVGQVLFPPKSQQ